MTSAGGALLQTDRWRQSKFTGTARRTVGNLRKSTWVHRAHLTSARGHFKCILSDGYTEWTRRWCTTEDIITIKTYLYVLCSLSWRKSAAAVRHCRWVTVILYHPWVFSDQAERSEIKRSKNLQHQFDTTIRLAICEPTDGHWPHHIYIYIYI